MKRSKPCGLDTSKFPELPNYPAFCVFDDNDGLVMVVLRLSPTIIFVVIVGKLSGRV